jgi:methylmalonyl-CoA mutase, N-terminal domain
MAIPTEDSVRVALRTQQIIAHETGVGSTLDPLGGSYYVEHVTDQIEEGALAFFERIRTQGGILEAIGSGWLAQVLTDAAYANTVQVETGKRIKVGVNKYCIEERMSLPIREADEEIERTQIAKLKKLRKERNNERVEASLKKLQDAAQKEVNLIPVLLETVQSHATMGEIFSALRGLWGEWRSL